MKMTIKRHVLFILLLIFSVVLMGCSDKKENKTTTIRIGYLPALAASPMYTAIAQDYFKEEGLDVKIQEVYSGPELINALQGKAIDIAFGIVPPLVLSRAKGLPIKSIFGATIDSKDVNEHRLMLPIGSDIKNGRDLKGKKIAVVAEGTSDYFGLLQYIEKHGLSKSDVEIIKTPHPEMIFAIASKSVDAACGIEPFITKGKLQGKIEIFDFYYSDDPTEIGTYLAHEDFIRSQPEALDRFLRAIKKGNQFVQNEQKLRKLLPTLGQYGIKFKLSEEAANTLTIMEFKESLTEKGIEKIMNQLIKNGNLDKPINIKDCIYSSR